MKDNFLKFPIETCLLIRVLRKRVSLEMPRKDASNDTQNMFAWKGNKNYIFSQNVHITVFPEITSGSLNMHLKSLFILNKNYAYSCQN